MFGEKFLIANRGRDRCRVIRTLNKNSRWGPYGGVLPEADRKTSRTWLEADERRVRWPGWPQRRAN